MYCEMKYRNTFLFLIVFASILTGCQEELPLPDANFMKVYGLDGESYAQDIIETEDGGFVIVGTMGKTSYDDNEIISGPFILKTDYNGNVEIFRHYPFTRGELKVLADSALQEFLAFNPDKSSLGSDLQIVYDGHPPAFGSIVKLKNGNYLARGALTGYLGGEQRDQFYFFMMFDNEFNLLKFKFLNNSLVEFQNGYAYRNMRRPERIYTFFIHQCLQQLLCFFISGSGRKLNL